MKLPKTILVAVDFDDTCDALLAGAAKVARAFGSEVVLMHAFEPADRRTHEGEGLEQNIADINAAFRMADAAGP